MCWVGWFSVSETKAIFSFFWNVNVQRFAERLWRNPVIKNEVSLCSRHWYWVHNLKWNIPFPPSSSCNFFNLFTPFPKWGAALCKKKRSYDSHGAVHSPADSQMSSLSFKLGNDSFYFFSFFFFLPGSVHSNISVWHFSLYLPSHSRKAEHYVHWSCE